MIWPEDTKEESFFEVFFYVRLFIVWNKISKFSTFSGLMINYVLNEFGWAGRENICLSVMTHEEYLQPL